MYTRGGLSPGDDDGDGDDDDGALKTKGLTLFNGNSAEIRNQRKLYGNNNIHNILYNVPCMFMHNLLRGKLQASSTTKLLLGRLKRKSVFMTVPNDR